MEAIEVASIKNIFCECETRPLSDSTLISGKARPIHCNYMTTGLLIHDTIQQGSDKASTT